MDRRALFSLAPNALASAALASAVVGLLAAAPAHASSSEKKEGGAVPASPYIPFGTITATIIRPDGRRGVMSVETGVNVLDEALRLRVSQDGPRLRSAWNEAVQRFGVGLRPGMAPDIEQLHDALQRATNRTLRRSGATLLIGTVMVV